MMLVAFWRLVLQCVKPAISLAMLYVNVVVSHVYDSTRVTLCSGFELFSDECIPNRASRKFYLTATGIRTRDLRIQNAALPSELQGQAENDLLIYDVSCISEVSPSMRKASY